MNPLEQQALTSLAEKLYPVILSTDRTPRSEIISFMGYDVQPSDFKLTEHHFPFIAWQAFNAAKAFYEAGECFFEAEVRKEDAEPDVEASPPDLPIEGFPLEDLPLGDFRGL